MITAPQGFPNWRALFEHLKTVGMETEQRVALVYQIADDTDTVGDTITPKVAPQDREEVYLTDEIKARAFEEIYDLLPDIGSVALVSEMLETASKLPGAKAHVVPAIEFLNKIPTRS